MPSHSPRCSYGIIAIKLNGPSKLSTPPHPYLLQTVCWIRGFYCLRRGEQQTFTLSVICVFLQVAPMGGLGMVTGKRLMTSTGQRIDGDEPARPMTSVAGTGYVSKPKQDLMDDPISMPGNQISSYKMPKAVITI